ncbi:MAG: hypothetical protein J0I33_07845 [Microbacterium ginsengisoli]|jgi:hypothetical protein|uniref:hypothetical protein n=1 Tax=Microbacterium TaxID=33882 RepID=UPI0006F8D712|nr:MULTISPECIES: hypothetical protein [unclassified Microbacterium]KQR97709.1 hypothetical protein ASF93_13350 [Microbacterium sp. Leaf347]KQS01733.1 hypothetical protein ASG00_09875 [Microbacterium sp. Leaf351]MBN9198536.1 hypothetical protein [Microbacterium ginsengisoli]OJU78080.1 MAG: hypothetical protein BGO15_02450 [Microbacterium sp. 71-23]
MGYQAIVGSADLTTKMRYISSYTFTENAGTPAAARVVIRDGSASGPVIIDEPIVAGGVAKGDLSKPVFCPSGVYVQVTTGTVRGSIRGT